MTGHMQSLQRSLTSSVEAYNKAVGSFESRVLVTARKFPGLGVVGLQSGEIDELAPIEKAPRHLQAYQPDLDDDELRQIRPSWRCPRAAPTPARRSAAAASQQEALPTRSPENTADVLCRGAARPPLRSHRRLGVDAGRTGGRAARGPDDARGRLRADEGHRAVAHAAPLGPLGRHARSARRGVRQHRLPLSGDAGLRRAGPGHGQRPEGRPVVARTVPCGRSWRSSSSTSTSPGWRRWPSTSATSAPPGRGRVGSAGASSAFPSSARGGPLRPLRRAPARHAAALGRRARRSPTRQPGRSSSGGSCATASAGRARRSAWTSACRQAAGRARPAGPPGPRSRCSA